MVKSRQGSDVVFEHGDTFTKLGELRGNIRKR
jgi:hypothetical protein